MAFLFGKNKLTQSEIDSIRGRNCPGTSIGDNLNTQNRKNPNNIDQAIRKFAYDNQETVENTSNKRNPNNIDQVVRKLTYTGDNRDNLEKTLPMSSRRPSNSELRTAINNNHQNDRNRNSIRSGSDEVNETYRTSSPSTIERSPSLTNGRESVVNGNRTNYRSRSIPIYVEAQTQTPSIQTQTTATDPIRTESKLSSLSGSMGSRRSETKRMFVETYTQTNNDTSINNSISDDNATNYHCPHCCNCNCCSDHQESDVEDVTSLPYQNNEEYLELLNELEKKLNARNRARVRRTIRQFELKSRQNRTNRYCNCCCSDDHFDNDDDDENNADNDDDDDDVDDLSLIKKLQRRLKAKCKDDNKRYSLVQNQNSDILQNENRWNSLQDRSKSNKSKWQYNPKSGEWYQNQRLKMKIDTPRSNPKTYRSCCCNPDCKKYCYQPNKRN